jgi:hypothetical protein
MLLTQSYIECIIRSPFYQGEKRVESPLTVNFNLNKPLPIRLDLYIDHILDNLNLPEEILVFSYILLEKYLTNHLISIHNLHSLIFTSISISIKFILNSWVTNSDLEKVGSLKFGSLMKMENDLLKFFNWKLQIFRYSEVFDFLANISFSDLRETDDEGWSDGEQVMEIEELSLAALSELECFFL